MPKIAKSFQSAETGRILLIDYLAEGGIILDQQDVKIFEKRPALKKKKDHISPRQHICTQECIRDEKIAIQAGYEVLFARLTALFF